MENEQIKCGHDCVCGSKLHGCEEDGSDSPSKFPFSYWWYYLRCDSCGRLYTSNPTEETTDDDWIGGDFNYIVIARLPPRAI